MFYIFRVYIMEEYISKPTLTEPGVKSFLNGSLRECRKISDKYYNELFNVGIFVSFCSFLALLLIYKYKGKETLMEKAHKDNIKRQYILSKIKNFQETKLKAQQSLITGLPAWED